MRILAVDGSSGSTSLAVVDDGVLVAAKTVENAAGLTRSLLAALDTLLREAGAPLATFDALALGRGPGSFTGLRASFATMRGVQVGAGLPLWGAGSLRALADASAPGARVLACVDARRDELFAEGHDAARGPAWFSLRHGRPEALGRDAAASIEGPVVIAGDLPPPLLQRLVACAPDRFVVAAAPGCLALEIARAVLRGDAVRDDGTLEPLYVRPPDAKLPAAVAGLPR